MEPPRVDLHINVSAPRYVWWAIAASLGAIGLAALLIADALTVAARHSLIP